MHREADRWNNQAFSHNRQYEHNPYGYPTATPPHQQQAYHPQQAETTHGGPPLQDQSSAFRSQYNQGRFSSQPARGQRTASGSGPRGYASPQHPSFFGSTAPHSTLPPPPPTYGSSAGASSSSRRFPTSQRSEEASGVFLRGQSTHHARSRTSRTRAPSPPVPYAGSAPWAPAPTPWQPPSREPSEPPVPPPAERTADGNYINVAGLTIPPNKSTTRRSPQHDIDLTSDPLLRASAEEDLEILDQSGKDTCRDDTEMFAFGPRDPSDPSYPKRRSAVGGWSTGFNDEPETGPSSAPQRTYGKTSAPRPSAPFKTPRSSVLTTRSSASSTNFYAGTQPSSSRGTLAQHAPTTPQELAGLKALERQKQQQDKQAKQGQSKSKTKPRADPKGKGKARAAPVIELDSDSAEDEDGGASGAHPHEDEDDLIESDDYNDRRPSTSAAGRAKRLSNPRGTTSRDFDDAPSSPDPLILGGTTRSHEHQSKKVGSSSTIANASRFADSKSGPSVRERVSELEGLGRQATSEPARPKLVHQLGPRKGKKVSDGSPTDDGELLPLSKSNGGKIPRAALGVIAAGPSTSRPSSGQIYEIDTKRFLIGRVALAAEFGASCYVVLTAVGAPSTHKLTLRTARGEQGYENEVELKAGDVASANYWPGGAIEAPEAYILFTLGTDKVFDRVQNLAIEPLPHPGERTVCIILADKPTPSWKDDPITAEDYLMHSIIKGWATQRRVIVQDNSVKAKKMMEVYSRRVQEQTRLEEGPRSKARKGKQSKADPKQPKLSFGIPSPLRRDEHGDYTERTPPTSRRGGSHDFGGEVEIQSGAPARRSSRQSTSEYANVKRPPDSDSSAAAPIPVLTEEEKEYQQWLKEQDAKYRPDEVVAEFPPGQPGAITLPWSDVKRLQPDEFLNDTLIELGLKQILQRLEEQDAMRPDGEKIAPQVHIFNSFFYKQLSTPKKKGVDPYKLVEKWTKKVKLFDKRFIIVPINEHFHWYLAMIINPAALLQPPPIPAEAPPLRQSERTKQRESTVGTDGTSDAQDGDDGEVKSHHFSRGRLPKALREQQVAGATPAGSEQVGSDVDVEMQDVSEAVEDREDKEEEEKVARGIQAELELKGDPLANSQSLAQVEDSAAQMEVSASPSGSPQPDPEQMQCEPILPIPPVSPARDLAPAMAKDGQGDDEEDVVIQRGSLVGGGLDPAIASSPRHKRWLDPPADNTSSAENNDVIFVDNPAKPASKSDGAKSPGVQTDSSPRKNAALAAQLFGEDTEVADARKSNGVRPNLKSNGEYGGGDNDVGDDDDEVLLVTTAKPKSHTSDVAESRAVPKSKSIATAAKTPLVLTPQDPEPDRADQLKREKEEEERRRVECEAAELAERKERQEQALRDAKEAVDMNGCWILTFDSLGNFHKGVTNKLKSYLVSEAMSKLGKRPEDLSIDQVQCGRADVPQQPNYCDCGLYLLHFVEHFLTHADFLLNVIAASQPSVAKGSKKTQQAIAEAEEFRNESWAFEKAKSRRARMRDEVKLLVEQYAEGAEERQQREEQEREQRRLKKAEAEQRRKDELARETVRRAEQLDSSASAAPSAMAAATDPADAVAAPAAPAGVVSSPAPLAISIRGAAQNAEAKMLGITIKGVAKSVKRAATPPSQSVLDLRDDHSSTQGSPKKPAERSDDLTPWADPTPYFADPAAAFPAAKSAPPKEGVFPEPAAPDTILSFSDDGGHLAALAEGVDAAQQSQGAPPSPAQTIDQMIYDDNEDAGHETGDLASSGPVEADPYGADEAEEEDVPEPPRRKDDHGRAPPVELAAEAEPALPIAMPQRDDKNDGSPELFAPPPNQQQQQQQQQREVQIGQKRLTRSSTRGSSPPGAVRAANGQSDSERPPKRVKSAGSARTSAGASRSSSGAASSRAPSPERRPGSAEQPEQADEDTDADEKEEEEPATLAKNSGKKARGKAAASGFGRGRGRGGRKKKEEPDKPVESFTLLDSDEEE
ncbi:hypothetical protein JCM10908_006759 [Rhodotorula pacifica]|uniref:uncharacterized protein n=1 Tax=Rhodotorula pacifica TaxID=1495444 RepID=UPI00316F2108